MAASKMVFKYIQLIRSRCCLLANAGKVSVAELTDQKHQIFRIKHWPAFHFYGSVLTAVRWSETVGLRTRPV